MPALVAFEHVTVLLDGTSGLSTGFLDEAFAGPIRERLIDAAAFKSRVLFVSKEDPTLVDLIDRYIRDAIERLQ